MSNEHLPCAPVDDPKQDRGLHWATPDRGPRRLLLSQGPNWWITHCHSGYCWEHVTCSLEHLLGTSPFDLCLICLMWVFPGFDDIPSSLEIRATLRSWLAVLLFRGGALFKGQILPMVEHVEKEEEHVRKAKPVASHKGPFQCLFSRGATRSGFHSPAPQPHFDDAFYSVLSRVAGE